MNLKQQIYSLRKTNSLTLQSVSQATGLSVSYLSDLERGVSNPSIETLQTLSDFYQSHFVIGKGSAAPLHLDERELLEINFAQMYAKDYKHGTAGHNRLMLIAKLANYIGGVEPVSEE